MDSVIDTLGDKEFDHELSVLKENGVLLSLRGVPNRVFAQKNGFPPIKRLLFTLAGAKYDRKAKRQGKAYRFLFVRADGVQLEKITQIVEANHIVPNTNSQLNSSIIHCLPVMLEMTWLDNVQMVSHKRSTTFSRVAKISLRNPRLRISFQICSIGFISGVYGGIWKRTIFSGNSNPTDLCHAAPSQQSNMMSSEYCSDNCFRKIFMHAVLQ